MCALVIALGAVMMLTGTVLILRFFVGHGANRPEVAGIGRTESMILGVILVALGPLLFFLGVIEAVCRATGIA